MANEAVNIDQVVVPVNGVENSPVLDRIFGKARQVRCDRFVAQVINVGGDPFGLVQESLCLDGSRLARSWRMAGR